jgi:3-methyladenine DNA glycosylase AlkD
MKATPGVAPDQLVRLARRALRRAGGGAVPRRATQFFKPWERVYAYGIATPQLRAILRQLYRVVRRDWRLGAARTFAERMLRDRSIEGRTLGIELLGRFERAFEPALLAHARRWLAAGLCDNWALTDDLSIRVLAPLLRRYPQLVRAVASWARARSLWVRRAAAVSLVPLARQGAALNAAYETATRLFLAPEDLIHKATGWLLREAGARDRARLEAFLIAQGPRVPRTALRYAIERFPAGRRRVLLARTKGKTRGRDP